MEIGDHMRIGTGTGVEAVTINDVEIRKNRMIVFSFLSLFLLPL